MGNNTSKKLKKENKNLIDTNLTLVEQNKKYKTLLEDFNFIATKKITLLEESIKQKNFIIDDLNNKVINMELSINNLKNHSSEIQQRKDYKREKVRRRH